MWVSCSTRPWFCMNFTSTPTASTTLCRSWSLTTRTPLSLSPTSSPTSRLTSSTGGSSCSTTFLARLPLTPISPASFLLFSDTLVLSPSPTSWTPTTFRRYSLLMLPSPTPKSTSRILITIEYPPQSVLHSTKTLPTSWLLLMAFLSLPMLWCCSYGC